MELKQEQALIRAAKSGNEAAVSALYEEFVDKIYRYLYHRLNSRQTAEDLTSEVFVRFIESLPSYEDRNLSVLVWLYRIAHDRLVDYYRAQKRSSKDVDLEAVPLSVETDVDAPLMADYHQEQLRVALQQLTPEQQQVVALRFIEGYDLQETADTVGKSVGAVKLLQHRALQALSRLLSTLGQLILFIFLTLLWFC